MQRTIISIITVIMLFMTGLNTSAADIFGSTDSSKLVIRGNLGSDNAGESVTVLILKSDAEVQNCKSTDIMYFNSIRISDDGAYAAEFECEGIEYTDGKANCRLYIKQGNSDVTDSLIYAAVEDRKKCIYELDILDRLGEKTAVLSVENPFMTDTSAQLILASYKADGTLESVQFEELDINKAKQGLALSEYRSGNDTNIKAFVWSSINQVMPLANAVKTDIKTDTSHKDILIVGNSYSIDSARYVHDICESIGADIDVYILGHAGGTVYSLWSNRDDASYYNYSRNGATAERKVSLETVLSEREYDAIIMQNYWGASDGILYESNAQYDCSYPDAYKTMAQYLASGQPEAELLINSVWSNEIGYNASDSIKSAAAASEFADMENAVQRWSYNQLESFNNQAAIDCGKAVEETSGVYGRPLRQLPVGYAVQLAREYEKNGEQPFLTIFNDETKISDDWADGTLSPISSEDEEKGRLRLNRDGYHLSFAGRYLAGLVWAEILTGYDVSKVTYIPEPEWIQCGVQATGSATATTDSIKTSFNPITEEQAADLRYIAHNAVKQYYEYAKNRDYTKSMSLEIE